MKCWTSAMLIMLSFVGPTFGALKRGETLDNVLLTAYTPNTKTCRADKQHGGPDSAALTDLKPSEYSIGKDPKKDKDFVMVAATRKCTGVADRYARVDEAECKKRGGKVGATSHLLGCFFKIDAPGMEGRIFYAGDTYGRKQNSRKLDITYSCDAYRDRMGLDAKDKRDTSKQIQNNPKGQVIVLSCGHMKAKGNDLVQIAAAQSRQFKYKDPRKEVAAASRPNIVSRAATYVTRAYNYLTGAK